MSSMLRRSARIAARACSTTTASLTSLTPLALVTSANIIGSQLRPRPSVRAATAFFHPTVRTIRQPRRSTAVPAIVPTVVAPSASVVAVSAAGPAAAQVTSTPVAAVILTVVDTSVPAEDAASLSPATTVVSPAAVASVDAVDVAPSPKTKSHVIAGKYSLPTAVDISVAGHYELAAPLSPSGPAASSATVADKTVRWVDEVAPRTAVWKTVAKYIQTKDGRTKKVRWIVRVPVGKVFENSFAWKSDTERKSNYWDVSKPARKARGRKGFDMEGKDIYTGADLINFRRQRTPADIAQFGSIQFFHEDDDPILTQRWPDDLKIKTALDLGFVPTCRIPVGTRSPSPSDDEDESLSSDGETVMGDYSDGGDNDGQGNAEDVYEYGDDAEERFESLFAAEEEDRLEDTADGDNLDDSDSAPFSVEPTLSP